MNDLIEIAHFVAAAVWQVWPLFLVSIILSVLIRMLKLDGVIRRAFQANVATAIVLATLVGAFSPFCSCTVVPVIAVVLGLATAFLSGCATPQLDPLPALKSPSNAATVTVERPVDIEEVIDSCRSGRLKEMFAE